jgi:16S rRNA (guanine527-N7)-methyltransferase
VNDPGKAYLDLLFKWNRAVRLTAFTDTAEAMDRGYRPSLAALPHLAEGARLLDLGSGGGFPAIPLALERRDLRVTCCEPSREKCLFLREASVRLGLDLEVRTVTAEELLRTETRWDAITVRGLKLRRGVLRRTVKALNPGGVLLVWSGGDRAGHYAAWMRAEGLEVSEAPQAEAGVVLVAGIVPRGTPPDGPRGED